MRILLPAAAALIFCMSASAQSQPESYSFEPDTYRHGGTYSTANAGSADSCSQLCRTDRKCVVWSYRKPNTAAGPSQCELKQSIGHAEHNPLMTSGMSPRLSSQQEAIIPAAGSDLLGGTSSPAPVPARPAPRPRAATAAPTQLRESAFGSPANTDPRPAASSSEPVLNANDPRIIRRDRTQPASRASVEPEPALRGPAPIRQGGTPPPPRLNGEARPYDNLRNREFPRYSVQDGKPLQGDGAAGAGS